MYKTHYTSPVGNITLISDGDSLTGLSINGQNNINKSSVFAYDDRLSIFVKTKEWLDNYFNGERVEIGDLKILPAGSAFRERVWNILREIPYGELITYGDIAKRIAEDKGINKMSAQAVGGAVGHNPISIIIPCHRVIGVGGNLTGYGGGIDLKIKLLQIEGIDVSRFKKP